MIVIRKGQISVKLQNVWTYALSSGHTEEKLDSAL